MAQDAYETKRQEILIQALPPEILLNIFPLIKPCFIHHRQFDPPYVSVGKDHYLYPNTLSHVCRLWRCLVIGLPHLWSHVDLALYHPLNPGLFARAKFLAVRAGDTPLEIHVCDPCTLGLARRTRSPSDSYYKGSFNTVNCGSPENSEESGGEKEEEEEPEETQDIESDPGFALSSMNDFKFLPSSPTLIKSLELDLVAQEEQALAFRLAVLAHFLDNCTPEVFVSYSTQQLHDPVMGLPTTKHERVWRQAKILRLNGTYPRWEIPAFHGLIELRVGHKIPWLSESALVNALKSSPKLRVLHLKITPPELADNSNQSNQLVYLEDLEEVEIDGQFSATILPRVVPGAKPLQLSVRDVPYNGHTLGFYGRSSLDRRFQCTGFSYRYNAPASPAPT